MRDGTTAGNALTVGTDVVARFYETFRTVGTKEKMKPLRLIPDGLTVPDVAAHHYRPEEYSIADIFSLGRHANFPSGRKDSQTWLHLEQEHAEYAYVIYFSHLF